MEEIIRVAKQSPVHRNADPNSESFYRLHIGISLSFIVALLAFFQFHNKWRHKYSKASKNMTLINEVKDECIRFEDLPRFKPSLPLGFVGALLDFFPLEELYMKGAVWTEQYGDLVTGYMLNEKFIFFNSGPLIQALMKSSDIGHTTKSPIAYNPMKPFITNGVLVSKGAFWQRQRKILLKSQSFQKLKECIPMVERHSKQLVHNMETVFQDGEEHSVDGLISTTFLRIINEMITGKQCDLSDDVEKYHHNFSIWAEVMFKRIVNPLLLLKPIWMLHPLFQPHTKAVKELFDFAKQRLTEHIATRKDNLPKIRTMLDDLLDAGIDEKQIVDEINTMMFGGHETGAAAIHSFCFVMALNSDIQETARKEIDEVFEDPSHFQDGGITYECIQTNFKYLERCILETMRLYPPVFAMMRKLDAPLQIEYKEKPTIIPSGANVIVSPFMLHRRQEYFPDPEKFHPDRFLPNETAKRHAYSFIPFSAGPRNCMGQKFAMIEMKIMSAYIIRNFELTTTDKPGDVPLLPYTTLTPARGYNFQLKRRRQVAMPQENLYHDEQ